MADHDRIETFRRQLLVQGAMSASTSGRLMEEAAACIEALTKINDALHARLVEMHQEATVLALLHVRAKADGVLCVTPAMLEELRGAAVDCCQRPNGERLYREARAQ